jgi:extracellular elastinolytic metalloproteinase
MQLLEAMNQIVTHWKTCAIGFALVWMTMAAGLQAQQPAQIAAAHLALKADSLGLTAGDVTDLLLTDNYRTQHNGITHVYFRQAYQGIGIWQAVANVNVNNQNRVISFGCSFLPNASARTNGTVPLITAAAAIATVAASHNLPDPTDLQILQGPNGPDLAATFSKGGISQENIPVRLMYVEDDHGQLRLCWDLSILPTDGKHWWCTRVDAQTSQILSEVDWNVSCRFRVDSLQLIPILGNSRDADFLQPGCQLSTPNDQLPGCQLSTPNCQLPGCQLSTPNCQLSITAPNTYNVYPDPIESPNHGSRSIVASPWVLAASPFGWHDTNGAAGAEFTITRGNNVHAQEDQNDNNGTGASPNGTATLTFDFPLNFNNAPATNLDAATTNLFYWNNRIHDVWYMYGFDDPSGNFQSNNYGRGGTGNDYVLADAQDGGGTDNANFATPAEGTNPRMQMYLWTAQSTITFLVNSPASVAGSYFVAGAAFGPNPPVVPITANLVLVNDGTGAPTLGCNALTNGAAVSGRIALVDRGTCTFVQKVQMAQNAGAVACVVCNNTPGSPTQLGGASGGITIPSVMLSQGDCAILRALLNSPAVNVSLSGTVPGQARDGDFDNGIVVHEYGHGVSNRLTGGPANVNCLNNAEQMGEGWSDWMALMMTMLPSDVSTKIRGMGTYAIFEPTNGGGIRPAPYTTDMNINPFTYGDITNTAAISQPHGIGFLWCSMLWEMTWALIGQHGYDPDLVNGTGGNNIAMRLVIDGMKLQPCNPGFVNGRDAILLADMNDYAGAHQCLIWQAFAKRGLGFSASQGSANSRADGSEAFDLPPACGTFAVNWLNVAATPAIDKILVDWSVAQVNGTQYFEVERRAQGQTYFNSIGMVNARPQTGAVENHTFPDRNVLPGITYEYRIREVDANGIATYSEIVRARLEHAHYFSLSLAPNPSQGMVTVKADGDLQGILTLDILNLVGQKVHSQEVSQNAILSGLPLDLSHLANGTYFIQLKNGSHRATERLTIDN